MKFTANRLANLVADLSKLAKEPLQDIDSLALCHATNFWSFPLFLYVKLSFPAF